MKKRTKKMNIRKREKKKREEIKNIKREKRRRKRKYGCRLCLCGCKLFKLRSKKEINTHTFTHTHTHKLLDACSVTRQPLMQPLGDEAMQWTAALWRRAAGSHTRKATHAFFKSPPPVLTHSLGPDCQMRRSFFSFLFFSYLGVSVLIRRQRPPFNVQHLTPAGMKGRCVRWLLLFRPSTEDAGAGRDVVRMFPGLKETTSLILY